MDWARGHANDDSGDRHVACNYAAGANNRSVADATALRCKTVATSQTSSSIVTGLIVRPP